jgi:hypothetical protein
MYIVLTDLEDGALGWLAVADTEQDAKDIVAEHKRYMPPESIICIVPVIDFFQND